MLTVPKPHPKEFRDDVVAVARKGEAPIAEIAKDFGISESCLRNWLSRADVEDGRRPGATAAESAELPARAARTRA
jgi:transposase-like protein